MNADELTKQFLYYRKLAAQMPALAEVNGYPHISGGVMQIIWVVKEQERYVQEMADLLGISQQAVGKMVKEALKSGVVTMRVNEDDRRSRVITITPVGQSVWSTFQKLCSKY